MKLSKKEKTERSAKLGAGIRDAQNIFFTEYQGLKFIELAELRAKLRPLRCRYSVMKNSILRYALKAAGIEGADPKLVKGPVGLVVSAGDDPVAASKVLAQFAKEFPKLKVKAGLVSRQWMTQADCQKLATLGTKPELLAKLAGALHSTVAQAAGVLQAPIRDLILTIRALEEKNKTATA